jgi:NAD-dependent deacetylase
MSADRSEARSAPFLTPALVQTLRSARRVVAVTGAGMSAESGVPTFRDAQTGLWEQYDAQDLATPEAWERDRAFVWAWYLWRFGRVHEVAPNDGHHALAEWARHPDGPEVSVVTQNVDDLHERAGSDPVVHLHGSLAAHRCEACDAPYTDAVDLPEEEVARVDPPRCRTCGASVRPGVVWFGELLPMDEWARGVELVEAADLVLVVGTSGLVHPAAGLPALARAAGAVVIEVHPRATEVSHVAHHVIRSTAAQALPALVAAATG